MTQPDVDRLENEIHRNPDKRKEEQRPVQKKREHDPTEDEKTGSGPFISADDESAFEVPHKIKARHQFCTAKNRGDHGCETERRPKGIFQSRELLGAKVNPILGSKVQNLEQPPDWCGNEEQANVFGQTALEQGHSRASKDQPIDRQAVSQPQRKESPMRARTGQGPVEDPEDKGQDQSNPAVNGKVIILNHIPSLHEEVKSRIHSGDLLKNDILGIRFR